MSDDPATAAFIGPKIAENSRLNLKLNHYFILKKTKGLSLNQQLAAHPDFHAPGITDTLLNFMGLDPWASNLSEDVSNPAWEHENQVFDYVKVAQEQRQAWESKNPQIMNAAATSTNNLNNRIQMPRKRI